MDHTTEVLIVGGGPGGAFLAYKLAKAGIQTLVLEKNTSGRRKVCGEYLCPLGVSLLEQENLKSAVLNESLPLQGMLIVTAQGTEVPTQFPNRERYVGAALNRATFDNHLLSLAENAGAKIRRGATVNSIERKGDLWSVHTNIGTFTTRLLVGADGRSSVVSKNFHNDLPSPRRRVALHAFVYSQDTNLRRGEMHLFANGSYIGINPTGSKEINFSLVIEADELRELGGPLPTLNHYLARSKNLRSRFQPFTDETSISAAFPIHHRTRSFVPADNVVLVGDAAGFVDPLTGEGMYNALRSAQILGNILVRESHRAIIFPAHALQEYAAQHAKALRQKTILNRGFQQIIARPFLVEKIARFLLTRQRRADAFVGMIGNIYSPIQGLLRLF